MTTPGNAAIPNSSPATRPATPPERVLVWDRFVRFFHWSLVGAVLVAFLTGDAFEGLHVLAGYVVMTLLAARLIWGVVGPKHARWWDFVHGPRVVTAYLLKTLRGHPARYLGHNPASGAMVVAFMVGLTLTTLTGLAAQSLHLLKGLHELIAYATLCLVPVHLLGVALASFQHQENLVRGMIDGYKRK